jgi:hypothetical protein
MLMKRWLKRLTDYLFGEYLHELKLIRLLLSDIDLRLAERTEQPVVPVAPKPEPVVEKAPEPVAPVQAVPVVVEQAEPEPIPEPKKTVVNMNVIKNMFIHRMPVMREGLQSTKVVPIGPIGKVKN